MKWQQSRNHEKHKLKHLGFWRFKLVPLLRYDISSLGEQSLASDRDCRNAEHQTCDLWHEGVKTRNYGQCIMAGMRPTSAVCYGRWRDRLACVLHAPSWPAGGVSINIMVEYDYTPGYVSMHSRVSCQPTTIVCRQRQLRNHYWRSFTQRPRRVVMRTFSSGNLACTLRVKR